MRNSSFPQWTHPFVRAALSASTALALAVPAHAANNCPWLNEATASGLLGGDAVGAFQASSSLQPAVCTFTDRIHGATRTLRIQVETPPDTEARLKSLEKSCGPGITALPAIGNEAVACSTARAGKQIGEQAIGRARDQIFVIRIHSSMPNDPVLTRPTLTARIRTAAAQVSGNLF